MAKLDDQLAALATMSPAQLRANWRETFREPAPELSVQLLALGIAHHLQERAYGGLPNEPARALARLERRFARMGEIAADEAALFKTGSILVRVWRGQAHHVLILDYGYVYREQRYRSLSEIARAITGTNWSGPRFFGLGGKRRG